MIRDALRRCHRPRFTREIDRDPEARDVGLRVDPRYAHGKTVMDTFRTRESSLGVIVAEMKAQPGCQIGHRGVEAWTGAGRWQAPRSSRVDDVRTGLAATRDRSPGRKPRVMTRISSELNKRAMGRNLVARHRPERDSRSRGSDGQDRRTPAAQSPGTYSVGDYSAHSREISMERDGSRSNFGPVSAKSFPRNAVRGSPPRSALPGESPSSAAVAGAL